jgi:hypothetical protein
MARAKTDSQKNIFQARMKNALQTLSNIRKDLGTKKESISESVLVYKINQPAVEKFLKKYPRVNQIMKTLVTKNKDVMKGYKAFLKLKDSNEDYLGGRAEVSSSPTFGTKTFYKYDWNGVGGWAELYQYLYNQQNESVNEAGPCWKGYKQVGMKDKSGKQVPNCVPESLDLNESHFSEIDLMAKQAKSFRQFVNDFYKEYPKLPKDKESMKWLEGLYKSSISEVVDDKGNERVALSLPQTKEESVNEDCGCNKNTLTEGVAKEILAQLGGNKFVAMTGAKNLVDGGKFLAFKLPRAKDSINYVKITLTSMDLYDIEFGRIRANQYKVVKKVDGVYNDQLQSIFTKVTGLYTRL